MLSITVEHTVAFHELDPMNVVWHGNYVNFFELARAALLDKIGLSYTTMYQLGYIWPVVKLQCKYIRPAHLGQRLSIQARITDYRNTLTMEFSIHDAASGELITKGKTMQMAVRRDTGESTLVSPDCMLEIVEKYLYTATPA